LKIKSTFSLKETQADVIVTEQSELRLDIEEKKEAEEKTPITQQVIENALGKYASAKKESGAMQLYTTLSTSQVILHEYKITLALTNQIQLSAFENAKHEILLELKQTLQCPELTLSAEVNSNTTEITAFKPNDIFSAMAEKNPALLQLKKRFDLEIDY
jgi:DNA polymerase III subunit gamma/tau